MKVQNGVLKGELKAKNGKLLKCTISYRNKRIEKITITGDFFMYPEEKIEELEEELAGIEMERGYITRKIDGFFSCGVTTLGAKKDDFVEVIMQAVKTIKTPV